MDEKARGRPDGRDGEADGPARRYDPPAVAWEEPIEVRAALTLACTKTDFICSIDSAAS